MNNPQLIKKKLLIIDYIYTTIELTVSKISCGVNSVLE